MNGDTNMANAEKILKVIKAVKKNVNDLEKLTVKLDPEYHTRLIHEDLVLMDIIDFFEDEDYLNERYEILAKYGYIKEDGEETK